MKILQIPWSLELPTESQKPLQAMTSNYKNIQFQNLKVPVSPTMMFEQQYDPALSGRAMDMQATFLNYAPFAGSSSPDVYTFSGNAYSLANKAKDMSDEQLSKYKALRINVSGTVVKNNNMCCFWNTVIWGSIFLFPLFFICCDWWKRIVNKLYSVQQTGYEGVAEILRASTATQLYLMVQDNFFNQQKAQILNKALERSRVKNFVFNNTALGFNAQKNNYSDFDSYMRPIKQLHLNADMSWANKFVI